MRNGSPIIASNSIRLAKATIGKVKAPHIGLNPEAVKEGVTDSVMVEITHGYAHAFDRSLPLILMRILANGRGSELFQRR